MIFNSYTFLIFFAVVLVVCRIIGSWSARKVFLLVMSYLFYAAWNPPFVLLLVFSTVVDWFLARAIQRSTNSPVRRLWLVCSLFVNLGMLGIFKYGLFAIHNAESLMRAFGVEIQLPHPSIILPVGISFYTFQTLSYTFDVYRKKMEPWDSFLDYALYVTFFPQLVAGPILRAADFLPQCKMPRLSTSNQITWGITLITIGLFNKVVVADSLMSQISDIVFKSPMQMGALESWVGTVAFSIQIFCDFAGYSSCAIGVALCLGFVLPDNFRFPYAAIGFSDFWKRWHISLSSWLRDYLYVSLGGNRKGNLRTHVNLMLTMLIGGFWHGASWLFVIWGGLHGLYLVGERWLRGTYMARWPIWRSATGRILLVIMTYLLVCITWVFFRARTLADAWFMTQCMVGVGPHSAGGQLTLNQYVSVGVGLLITLTIHYRLRDGSLESTFGRWPAWLRAGAVAAMAFAVLLGLQAQDRAFIYFQF